MLLNQFMLDVCEEALYLLRQDVSLPTLANAPTDASMEWVKCRKAFDYAANEVLAAHDWRFARTGSTVGQDVGQWPFNLRKVLVYCLARELSVQIAGRTEDLKNYHQLYNRFLFEAKLKDLEEDRTDDPVAKEVVATLRGYFSDESKDIPRSMVSVYDRIDAVRDASFEEVKAAHDWTNKATITDGDKLPPIARQAWIVLIEAKLATACGVPPEAVAKLEEVYLDKLNRARVADLEATAATDATVKEVLAAVRPFFSADQKNLPRTMVALYERVSAVKAAAFNEVKAAHEWTNKSTITDGDKLPPVARAAWITLMEIKLGTACGIPQEAVAQWQSVYLAKLNQARVIDLEAQTSSDAVASEVLAGIRPYFALDQKNLPLTMTSFANRIGAVKESAFREILAAHEWAGKEDMEDGDDLPATARAAWVALMQQKLCVACGFGADAVGAFETIWRSKLAEARVIDLEASESTDSVVQEVLAAVRPYFSEDQKNLPRKMLSLYGRISAVKTAAFNEVKAAHEWTNKATMTTPDKLQPVARAAWIILIEIKLGTACGIPQEAIAGWQNVYLAKLNQARVIDLEGSKSTDSVVKEVVAAVRPFFALDQKNLPLKMIDLYERVDAVKVASFEEVKAAHDWTNASTITDGDKLPPIARQAWIVLIEAKLATACGVPPEAVAKLEEVYLDKLTRARVAELEAQKLEDPVYNEVVAGLRPYFSSDQKNLPRTMLAVYERVSKVQAAAFREILGSHEWTGKATMTSGADLPPVARAAWIALVQQKLCVACGLGAEAIAAFESIWRAKLVEARVIDLEATVATDATVKEVLAAVRPFFSTDQKNLPRRMLDLYERVNAVKTSAFNEVKAAHDWANKATITTGDQLPPVARAAWIVLMEIKLGTACGIPQEAIASWQGVYLQKLVQARVIDLEGSKSSDPVVKEVVAGIRPFFAIDQKSLPMKMLDLYGRVDDVKGPAFEEILAAHDWQGKEDMEDGDDLPAIARAAWIALMQQKLCIACGLTAEAAAGFEAIWRAKLKEARVSDLETTPVPEGVEGEVLTLIRDSFDVAETNLPRDLKTLADRIARLQPLAMREVLSAHPWSFAMEEWRTGSGRVGIEGVGDYSEAVTVPDDCIKVIGVYGRDGELLNWERVAGEIRADGKVCRVTYVRNVDELDEFSPDAYRLVVLRLAADMTRAMSLRASLQNLHENVYRDALAEAKTRDTRQSNPGPAVVWGGNYYVDRMTGRRA